jgi:diguanylate cyclase (GGDEF)-like protein
MPPIRHRAPTGGGAEVPCTRSSVKSRGARAESLRVTSVSQRWPAGPSEEHVDAAVGAVVPLVAGVVAAGLLGSAAAHWLTTDGTTAPLAFGIALAAAVALSAVGVVARRGLVPEAAAHPAVATAVLALAGTGLAQLVLTARAEHTSTVLLALVLAGSFLLSLRWLVGTVYLIWGGWVAGVVAAGLRADIAHHATAMLLATGVAVGVAYVRRQALVELGAARERAEAAAFRDDLTGVANRRGLAMLGAPILEAARRQGDAVHCAFLDIAGLGSINDRLGRSAGDEVLIAVAYCLRSATRATDVVARWGGDEFCVLGPGAGIAAPELERRVVEQLVAAPPVDRRAWRPYVDVGGAVLAPWDSGTLDTVLARAEQEMRLRRAMRQPAAQSFTAGGVPAGPARLTGAPSTTNAQDPTSLQDTASSPESPESTDSRDSPDSTGAV